MQNNCLVTKLKGSVNSYLPKLGVLTIKLMATPDSDKRVIDSIGGSIANPLTLDITNGAFYKYHNDESLGTEVVQSSAGALKVFVDSGGGTIDLTPKYNIVELNISKYKLVSNQQVLSGLIAQDFVFNLEDFAYCEGLTKFLGSNDLYGNIMNLAKCTSLIVFSVSSGNVTGEIKELVNAWIDNGRASSGSMTRFAITPRTSLLYAPSDINITLNGTRITSSVYNSTLHWESRSKIYLLDGDKVKCTGYTDGEIATNTASGGIWEGKTIVKY